MYTVVVESPAKAKTINKYLGKDYTVLASFGHVRDLPSKDGSVEPDNNFIMHYEVDPDSKKHIQAIAKAVKDSDTLFLATDPDREGEAISWHVLEALQQAKAIKKGVVVKRVVFEEITKSAVLEAFQHPRDIDMNLVNAQQARRALDYLVGFTLSPVLWRKLPGSKSAGRVQSVALRLICERDAEIEKFISQEYWDIKAILKAEKADLTARLTEYKGEKLEKFSITNEAQAKAISADVGAKQYNVKSLEPKTQRRHPAPPFTTSTLQQEASRKLGFGAKRTMQVAQKLYEGITLDGETTGLITYMRTDSVAISGQALSAARNFIEKEYGKPYLPDAPRAYKTKAKNAQEAHEAIRPTDLWRTPAMVSRHLDKEMLALYELVWKRMMASQMESAVYDQLVVDIISTDKQAALRATGSVLKFDGFMRLYMEGKDDEEDEEEARLPELKENESLKVKDTLPEQHFTEPPPRYTEATLVKKLEELGIGRPSTYAAIISVLQDRKYVTLDKKRFIAEPLGRIVNAFLVSFFERYVEYSFTANLEDQLDDVAQGEREWKSVLREFWNDFIEKIEDSKKLSITEVLQAIDALLSSYLFGKKRADGSDAHSCPACKTGTLGVKLGRFGAYIACSAYPDCNYKAQVGEVASGASGEVGEYPKLLGQEPKTGIDINLKKGPYGFYVQLGEGEKPKRASLLKNQNPEDITLEIAIGLLALPREVGNHPETGLPITASIGRFGPYLLHDKKYTSLPPDESPLTVGINRAVDILANSKKGGGKGFAALKELGEHPEDGKPVKVMDGRYGPYIKWNKVNATLPKGTEPDKITMAEAVEILSAKSASPSKKKKAARKKA